MSTGKIAGVATIPTCVDAPTHVRRGHQIFTLGSDEVVDCPSINEAKRRSRKLQGTALGRGSVRVIPHKVKKPEIQRRAS